MATKGYVNGQYFSSGREMVEMIYRIYFDNNSSITLAAFEQELEKYNFKTKINDLNQKSFLKSETSYNTLNNKLKEKHYSPNAFVIGGNKYYLVTETGEPDTSEHIRFARDHGIFVSNEKQQEIDDSLETMQSENFESDEETDNDDFFKLIQISDLENKKFYIPEYQRGYRWIDEAAYFIKDIENNTKKEYLFQPLVVKKITNLVNYEQKLTVKGPITQSGILNSDKNVYELIDGQQRLTTLYLVLNACKVIPSFEIYYERKRIIDNIYTKLATNEITKEVGTKYSQIENKLKTYARFVWYETDKDAKEIFQNINAGKTELTSAELFKALLINIDENNSKEFGVSKNSLLSYQFDEVETQLNDPNIWAFISNDIETETRIDYLLNIYFYGLNKHICDNKKKLNISKQDKDDLICRLKQLNNKLDKKFSFLSFSLLNEMAQKYTTCAFLNNYKITVCECWNEIYDLFEIIKSWYNNVECHNLIGYILACKGFNKKRKIEIISELVVAYKEKDYDAFIKNVYEKINNLLQKSNHLITLSKDESFSDNDDIKYNTDSKICYDLLLLSNIIPAINSQINFDFKHLKDKYNVKLDHKIVWDIEHINSQDVKKDIIKSYYGKSDFISNVIEPLNSMLEDDDYILQQSERDLIKNYISNYDTLGNLNSTIDNIWNNYVQSLPDTDNSITNLVLLSSDINRSYHNDFFGSKAKKIKQNDNRGLFIPIVTKRVFFKTFPGCNNINPKKWTIDDQQAYRNYLICVLDYIEHKKTNITYDFKGDN